MHCQSVFLFPTRTGTTVGTPPLPTLCCCDYQTPIVCQQKGDSFSIPGAAAGRDHKFRQILSLSAHTKNVRAINCANTSAAAVNPLTNAHTVFQFWLVMIYFPLGLYRVSTESAQVSEEQIKAYQQLAIWDSTLGAATGLARLVGACPAAAEARTTKLQIRVKPIVEHWWSMNQEWSTSLCLCAIILVEWSAFGVNRAQSKRVAHR